MTVTRRDSTLPYFPKLNLELPQGDGSASAVSGGAPAGSPDATPSTPGSPTNADRFELSQKGPAVPADPVSARASKAVQSYQERLTKILHHDAESLALGKTPVRSGADLSQAQLGELKTASQDLLMEMPIGSLSPAATAKAKAFLEDRGVDTTGFEQKTLKELGPVGQELAKNLADDFKEASPGAYYGLGAAAAVAAGAYGYLKGSDAIEKLGIKPEFKTKLFNDQVNVRAEGAWGERLKDPKLNLAADGNFKLNPHLNLRVGGNIRTAGPTLGKLGVAGGAATLGGDLKLGPQDRARFSGTVTSRFGDRGRFEGLDANSRFQLSRGSTRLDVSGALKTDSQFNLMTGNANVRLSGERGHLGLGANYDRATDALGYKLNGELKLNPSLKLHGEAALDRDFSLNQGNLGVQGSLKNGLDFSARTDFADGKVSGVRGSVGFESDAVRLAADINRNIRNDVTTGSLSLGYRPRDNLDLQIRGSMGTDGDKRIGVGMVWRF